MKTWILGPTVALAFALTFSLAACSDKEKLCEAGDESCEIGNGKCVVGYDGDCNFGQVCYAQAGAPKGKPGTCTDGQFDASGKLIATAVFRGFKGSNVRPIPSGQNARECFFRCPVADAPLPSWLGKAPATLEVVVLGPHAEAAQLKVSVRGAEVHGCAKVPERQQAWECSLPENWVGIPGSGAGTREPLELKLWTENTEAFPQTLRFRVDTQPLELELEARVAHERYLNGGGAVVKSFLTVNVVKKDIGRGWDSSWEGAWLSELDYFSLKVFRNDHNNDIEIPPTWQPGKREPLSLPNYPDYHIELPAEFKPEDTLLIQARVSAKDLAGNEVSRAPLQTTHPKPDSSTSTP